MADRIIAFPPVAPPGAWVLVLGSMPSVESLNQGFYYAHPRNAFWRILAEVFSEPFPQDVPARIELLHRHGVALWDVLHSCQREGSLDSAIREPEVNDFGGLFRQCPGIERILFNGGTAERMFLKHCGTYLTDRCWERLPSTSPAYTLSYERKLAQWREALRPVTKYEHQPL